MSPATISAPDASMPTVATGAPDQAAAADKSAATEPFATYIGQAIQQRPPTRDGSGTAPPQSGGSDAAVDKDKDQDAKTGGDQARNAVVLAALAQLAAATSPLTQPLPTQAPTHSTTASTEAPPPLPAAVPGSSQEGATVRAPLARVSLAGMIHLDHGETSLATTTTSLVAPSPSRPSAEASKPGDPAVAVDRVPSPALHVARSADAVRDGDGVRQAPSPTPPVVGTSGATTDAVVKTQVKTEGSSRSAEKNLPHGHVLPTPSARQASTGEKSVLPARDDDRSAPARTMVSAAANAARLANGTDNKAQLVDDHTDVELARPGSAEKIAGEITERVVAFKRIGSDSMEVSIRPDSATEMSLHLTMRNGQVEVAVRLERGDSGNLLAHWSGLQQSLSQQGVRVGPLIETNTNAQTLSHQSAGDSPSHSPKQRQQSPRGFDETPFVGAMTEPLKGRSGKAGANTRRGWEMWA